MANSSKYDIAKILSYQIPTQIDTFEAEFPILYALSIGLSRDTQKQAEDLKYTFEMHDEFTVFPTYGSVIPKSGDVMIGLMNIPGMPPINPTAILHGENRIEVYRSLLPQAKYETTGKILDIQDKGKSGILVFEVTNYEIDEDDNTKKHLAFKQIVSWFVKGMGGFGFKGTGYGKSIPKTPKREHDEIWEEKTDKNQALLYRLTGDKNPLHADPSFAGMAGFDVPILHGMNFYAISAKAVIKKFCNGDESQLFAHQARFTGHVFPGESIIFKMWREPGNIIVFSATTVERNTTCLKGFAELKAPAKL